MRRLSSKNPMSETRKKAGEANECFGGKRSSKGEKSNGVCGIGCFFICESNKEKGRRGYCFDLCSSKKPGGSCSCCFNRCSEKLSGSSEEKVQNSKQRSKKRESKSCCCRNKSPAESKPDAQASPCERFLSCFCCVYSRNESPSMKKKKKKGFCSWCQCKEKEKKEGRLATLVHNVSFNSDGGCKNKFDAEEILRLRNINIASRVFTYKELMAATNNFKADCVLGSGGFGNVYKGQLVGTNEVIAIKKLDRRGYQGSREFLIEVLMLGLLHHPNLVKLLGYCAEGDERILVYEYMPFGSLQDHLLDILPKNKLLDWPTRMRIAAGAARGLEHLHDVVNPPVIYRDMKASNVLLDENYAPKLSDFGLAKLGPTGDKSHVSTRVMGTYGYCAPEYALSGQLTKMSDIFSFGVLLLELITGRKAIDLNRPKQEQHLALWAASLFKDKSKLVEMADPLLNERFPKKGLFQALAIADMCLQQEASTRPAISDVVSAIEYLADPSYENHLKSSPPGGNSSGNEGPDCEISSINKGENAMQKRKNESLVEERHERCGTKYLSFDEEAFQSISSEVGSLVEENL